jgi:osmotically-inducible protein OsmY
MKTLPLLIALATFVFLIGCDADKDGEVQQQVSKGAQNALDTTKTAAQKGIETGQKTYDQVAETTKIKSALGSSDVDTSQVSVDTIAKTVYMIGNVPSQDMKDKADRIAKAIADTGYTVEDNLKVVAPAKTDSTATTH